MKAMVVDDDNLSREVASRMLARIGVDVTTVDEGKGALELFASAEREGVCFDVVFIDREMPGLDGVGTARAIRASEARRTYLVALTGNDEESALWDAGFDAVLLKPITLDELKHALERASSGGDTP